MREAPRSSPPRSRRCLRARGGAPGCSASPARATGSRAGRPDAMVPGQGLRVQVQEVQQLVIQVLADLLLLSIDVPLNSIPCLASCGEGETAAGSPDSCPVFPLGVQLVSAGAAPGFPCAPSAG